MKIAIDRNARLSPRLGSGSRAAIADYVNSVKTRAKKK